MSEAPGTICSYHDTDDGFIIDNDILRVRVSKAHGTLTSVLYRGIEQLSSHRKRGVVRSGYWDILPVGSASAPQQLGGITSCWCKIEKSEATVYWNCRYGGGTEFIPIDITVTYSLALSDSYLYCCALLQHPSQYPRLVVEVGRFVLKLRSGLYDYLYIDKERQRFMANADDWRQGVQTNLKEARLLVSGSRSGEVEHKYDYAALLFDTATYGWCSSHLGLGCWIVNPSHEYIAGGATKVELTGHIDLSYPHCPVLLNVWKGSHYGGTELHVPSGANWEKTIGPFGLYFNTGDSVQDIREDAERRLASEKARWPYSAKRQLATIGLEVRGTAAGKLSLDEQPQVFRPRNLLIGLTPYDHQSYVSDCPESVDWQRNASGYQFWIRTDFETEFIITNVRPGVYMLRAIADGILGEFSHSPVVVEPEKTSFLGNLSWKPIRFGRQMWEIGWPDRTARKFRNGNIVSTWGVYNRYPVEFPNDVRFLIGSSKIEFDWNYVHPARVRDGKAGPCTWSIIFVSKEQLRGTAYLRLAIAGSRVREKSGISVTVNSHHVGSTGPLLDTAVMHRDGIRGFWCERQIKFPASLLSTGENVVELILPADKWPQSIMYDYIRLELNEP